MAEAISKVHGEMAKAEHGFVKAIGLFDGTMIVVGSMIGSGIFIVSATGAFSPLDLSLDLFRRQGH